MFESTPRAFKVRAGGFATRSYLGPSILWNSFLRPITLEPKVVDPYNLGDYWSVDRDLSSGKLVPFFWGGGLLGGIRERAEKGKEQDVKSLVVHDLMWRIVLQQSLPLQLMARKACAKCNKWRSPSSSRRFQIMLVGFQKFTKPEMAFHNDARFYIDLFNNEIKKFAKFLTPMG